MDKSSFDYHSISVGSQTSTLYITFGHGRDPREESFLTLLIYVTDRLSGESIKLSLFVLFNLPRASVIR